MPKFRHLSRKSDTIGVRTVGDRGYFAVRDPERPVRYTAVFPCGHSSTYRMPIQPEGETLWCDSCKAYPESYYTPGGYWAICMELDCRWEMSHYLATSVNNARNEHRKIKNGRTYRHRVSIGRMRPDGDLEFSPTDHTRFWTQKEEKEG